MKEITTRNGYVAKVDDEDYDRVSALGWSAFVTVRCGRVYVNTKIEGKTVYLHRFVMGYGPGDPELDHASGDSLDNQKSNLRPANRTLQNANAKKRPGRSKYRGVHFDKSRGNWQAEVQVRGVRYRRRCTTEAEAALFYNRHAEQYFGEFARLNEVA